ncbi:hypothetical protein SLEP1_g38823 [Rubroshorea leprosula]|uniref:Uncharacterized protein n=1 Tax=Rubroshorea leprosula TaxID=152421 RepID=A0AAV5KY87_9ROSI|nr:hypothetical protein SLEP1_g38823 [Rubroshorea leprosula]
MKVGQGTLVGFVQYLFTLEEEIAALRFMCMKFSLSLP